MRPDAQRAGVGRLLMNELISRYAHCRAFVLTTDSDDAIASAFYRSLGFFQNAELGLVTYALRR